MLHAGMHAEGVVSSLCVCHKLMVPFVHVACALMYIHIHAVDRLDHIMLSTSQMIYHRGGEPERAMHY